MITLNNVSKIYPAHGSQVHALDEVSLQIDQGEFIAVCGHSGCGKSTLLSLIGGLALPTTGDVIVHGEEISQMPAGSRAAFRAAHIGFVFQMFHLLPYLNVYENVLTGAANPDDAVRGRAEHLLQKFGLADRMKHHPGELSAGERQRTALARALLNNPPLLLADEPAGNLDPVNAENVMTLLNDFHHDGGTILLVTHDMEAASRAGRTITLEKGNIAAVS